MKIVSIPIFVRWTHIFLILRFEILLSSVRACLSTGQEWGISCFSDITKQRAEDLNGAILTLVVFDHFVWTELPLSLIHS